MPELPAETLVRACKINRLIRFDHGKIISTDKRLMTVEAINPFDGAFHVQIDDVTLEHCEMTAKFSMKITVDHNSMLGFTQIKTATGYMSGNLAPTQDYSHYDRWIEVVEQCREPLLHSSGVMVWDTSDILKVAEASPSGVLVFEEHRDIRDRPVLVRDAASYEWFGLFMGALNDGSYHPSAKLPDWMKQG